MKLLNVTQSIKHGTNINSVVIPEELRVKHPTGIEWMDTVLGGGFTPSISGFVTGDPGCGKSTLVRTLANSLTALGHTVLYNCREESAYQVKMANERLDLKSGYIIGDDLYVYDVVAHAKELQKKCKNGKKVFVFVDSLQTLDDGKYDTGKTTKGTSVSCAVELIKWAKETFGVVLWVHQVTKGGVFVGDNQIKHAVDLHLHFGFDKDKKSDTFGERVLKKEKDRFGPAVNPLCVEMGKGGQLKVKPLDVDVDGVADGEDEAAE